MSTKAIAPGTACTTQGCRRTVSTATAQLDRNGKPYCRRCFDRLPRYLRHRRDAKKANR